GRSRSGGSPGPSPRTAPRAAARTGGSRARARRRSARRGLSPSYAVQELDEARQRSEDHDEQEDGDKVHVLIVRPPPSRTHAEVAITHKDFVKTGGSADEAVAHAGVRADVAPLV